MMREARSVNQMQIRRRAIPGSRRAVASLALGGTFALLALLVPTTHARAAAGVQLTPDSEAYLVSKDVSGSRWAITYNLMNQTVTGNVFPTDGGPPQFIWCQVTSKADDPDPTKSTVTMACRGTAACAAAPCLPGAYADLGTVTLPLSFFLPPNTKSTFGGNVEPILDATCSTGITCHFGDSLQVHLRGPGSYDMLVLQPSTEVPAKFFVEPFHPDTSYLIDKITGAATPRMPLSGIPLSDPQIESIRRWILEGAARN
jgi:hypothetical protein